MNEVKIETRRKLAAKVFRHTAAYDSIISNYLTELVGKETPETLTVTYELKQPLRYGENPHQKASFYRKPLGSNSQLPMQHNYMEKNFLITTSMMQMQHFKLSKNLLSLLPLR